MFPWNYIIFGSFGLAIVVLWGWAFRDLARTQTFTPKEKTWWFVIILLGPVCGSVAYLSARRIVERYSRPEAARAAADRLCRLAAKS